MFRPCIDLHDGKVKQIVGGSLTDEPSVNGGGGGGGLRTNFVSERSSGWYADLYRRDNLRGGHVIQLGPGNEAAAREALAAFPGGLQVGGGMRADNVADYLDAGASHVIVTSWVFRDGDLDRVRLNEMIEAVGKERLVLDLSCRRREASYFVVTDRWQKFTRMEVTRETLLGLADSCAEFLVHAVDVEGLCAGIDVELVGKLAEWSPIPTTYAGGARSIDDLRTVTELSAGRVDLTIGSALDIFGGTGITYKEAVAFNRSQKGS